MMNALRKTLITLAGGTLLVLGILLLVLPGPAVLLIPAGLGILALEYSIARVWLKRSQRWMSKNSRAIDRKLRRRI